MKKKTMNTKYLIWGGVLVLCAVFLMAQDIHRAAGQGDLTKVKEFLEKNPELLDAKDGQGNTPLMLAANSGQKDVVGFLITQRPNLNIANTYKYTPLHYSILRRHIDIAEMLIRAGADPNVPNVWGYTPLHTCAGRNFLKEADLLLRNKAAVNSKNEVGETPLFSAVKFGHKDMILLLIQNGADVNARNKVGRTPIFATAARNSSEILNLLIDQGANINVVDEFGQTALHRAAIAGYHDIVQILARAGAKIGARDAKGKTPYYYAATYGHNTLTERLMSLGAQPDVFVGDRGYFFFSELDLKEGEAVIWYLGHSGWTVKTRNHLLIFDYYENTDRPEDPRLINGRINPTEIYDQNVYVFISHRHADHFDKTILGWEHAVPYIRYIFGWQALDNPNYIYMGPKKKLDLDGMKIECFHSPEAGEIEANFLVEVDGVVIYHSGDYSRGHDVFKKDMQALAAAKDIDLFFMLAGNTMDNGEALYALQTVKPKYMFPMHAGGNEYVYKEFADFVKGKKVKSKIVCAENRGDRFEYIKGQIKGIQ
ncbi:MAG: ankyrin repeat domain-containing protein [Candidatus Aminicenantes bacterium]